MYRIVFLLLILCTFSVHAQDDPTPPQDDIRNHPTDVFLERSVDATGIDRLTFVDSLTGAETILEVYGQRYTPIASAILFFDQARGRVMLAYADGTLVEHPFIQPNIETRRVDWVINADESMIAWTLTNADSTGQLTTVTIVAGIDGSNARQVFVDGPNTDGIRALPLAFSQDNSTLYMDNHFDGLNDRMPITQYVRLFSVDLESGETALMPGEDTQACICGAGVNGGFFVRPVLNSTNDAFDVVVHDLNANIRYVIDAIALRDYIHVGDVLISPDGRYAVYALVQINFFGTSQQSTRTVFALVDLTTMSQTTLTQPITTLVRPVRWSEDNSAIIFTSPNQDGTWKIQLSDGRLDRIAEAAYLGTLRALNTEVLASG